MKTKVISTPQFSDIPLSDIVREIQWKVKIGEPITGLKLGKEIERRFSENLPRTCTELYSLFEEIGEAGKQAIEIGVAVCNEWRIIEPLTITEQLSHFLQLIFQNASQKYSDNSPEYDERWTGIILRYAMKDIRNPITTAEILSRFIRPIPNNFSKGQVLWGALDHISNSHLKGEILKRATGFMKENEETLTTTQLHDIAKVLYTATVPWNFFGFTATYGGDIDGIFRPAWYAIGDLQDTSKRQIILDHLCDHSIREQKDSLHERSVRMRINEHIENYKRWDDRKKEVPNELFEPI